MAAEDKERAKKDREAYEKSLGPKRPASAYLIFCSQKRDQCKRENPAFSMVQVMSALAKQWKELSDSEKEVSLYHSIASYFQPKKLFEKTKN